MKSLKKYVYIGLPILGVLFYICYLQRSAIDMIYSDYIRLINSYLPDVWNPEKFFVPDLLTRMPISYLGRAINVTFFDYSVTFDRMLSVLSFGVSALILGVYCMKHQVELGWFAAIMVFMFSLNKWEMLYNSTGWCHFMAFACFFYNYLVLDRVYRNEGKRGDMVLLALLPPFTTVIVAGPYCAIYSMTLFIAYGFIWVQNQVAQKRGKSDRVPRALTSIFGGGRCKLTNKQLAILVISVLWPLLAFIWSNSQAVYEHSGAVEGSMIGTFFQEPEFFLKFFLKSFASMVFGVEFISRHMSELPNMFWYVLGLVVFASYFLALWMNFHYGIYKKTIYPLMFLAGGGMNHLIVLVSRWIFMKESYGMSSRYALQYQIGILGILMTFGLVYRSSVARTAGETAEAANGTRASVENTEAANGAQAAGRKSRRRSGAHKNVAIQLLAVAIAAMFVGGNVATTVDEYDYGQHRKNHNLEVKERLLDFENQDEETLRRDLEYSKDGKKEALRILRDNGWNIFSPFS